MAIAPEELADRLTSLLGDRARSVRVMFGQVVAELDPEQWVEALRAVKDNPGLDLGFFCFLSAIDWSTTVSEHQKVAAAGGGPTPGGASESREGADGYLAPEGEMIQVVVRLASAAQGHGATFKTDLDHDEPSVGSLASVYGGADWHERECHEMFGVDFVGHPNPRKLYLPDGFEGTPLRKSFVLGSRLVKPWPGIVDVEAMPGEETESEGTDGEATADEQEATKEAAASRAAATTAPATAQAAVDAATAGGSGPETAPDPAGATAAAAGAEARTAPEPAAPDNVVTAPAGEVGPAKARAAEEPPAAAVEAPPEAEQASQAETRAEDAAADTAEAAAPVAGEAAPEAAPTEPAAAAAEEAAPAPAEQVASIAPGEEAPPPSEDDESELRRESMRSGIPVPILRRSRSLRASPPAASGQAAPSAVAPEAAPGAASGTPAADEAEASQELESPPAGAEDDEGDEEALLAESQRTGIPVSILRRTRDAQSRVRGDG